MQPTTAQLKEIDLLRFNPFNGYGAQEVKILYGRMFPKHSYCTTCIGDIQKMFQHLKSISRMAKVSSTKPEGTSVTIVETPAGSNVASQETASTEAASTDPAATVQAPAVEEPKAEGPLVIRFKNDSIGYRFHNQDTVYSNANLTNEIAELILRTDPSAKRLFVQA